MGSDYSKYFKIEDINSTRCNCGMDKPFGEAFCSDCLGLLPNSIKKELPSPEAADVATQWIWNVKST